MGGGGSARPRISSSFLYPKTWDCNAKFVNYNDRGPPPSPSIPLCLPSCLPFYYSASSVIRSSIIRHPDCPNAKFHKPYPHLQKPCGSWRLRNLAKWCFPIIKATAKRQKYIIHYQRKEGYRQAHGCRSYTERYGSRLSTTVAKSMKIHKGNGRHAFEDWCAAEARWALCFWFGLVTEWENHASYQVNVEVGFCPILTGKATCSIIII